ncbi:MAG: ABC transporter permease [Spirochaetota bacterium]|nr:ABC transporter permease [Spirochaetota bacterium]
MTIIMYSLPISVIIGISLGFYISIRPQIEKAVITITSIIMTIPSLALFGIMVVILAPLKLGIGITPAVVAIILYSLLPITRNTYTALSEVSPEIIEAAKGMGLTEKQILFRIKAPLSIPIILAGIRNAMVLGVSIATFAFLVAAGGLGYFIFSGINRSNLLMITSGALLVSLLGIGINYLLLKIEYLITPTGMRDNIGELN